MLSSEKFYLALLPITDAIARQKGSISSTAGHMAATVTHQRFTAEAANPKVTAVADQGIPATHQLT